MRLRTLFGVLSTLLWFIAIITVALPIGSVLIPGAISITQNQGGSGASSGGLPLAVPTSFQLTYHGFLPIDGVYFVVTGFYANGSQLFQLKSGPYDLNPGSSTQVNIATQLPTFPTPGPNTSPTAAQAELANFQAAMSNVTVTATATADLGGLVPISANADFNVSHLFNSTATTTTTT